MHVPVFKGNETKLTQGLIIIAKCTGEWKVVILLFVNSTCIYNVNIMVFLTPVIIDQVC